MSGLRVIGGPLKEYYFFKKTILNKVKNGQCNFIVLLPVNRAVRLFSRYLIDHSPGKVLLSPAIFTFDRFLIDIYKQLPKPKIVLERDLVRLLVSEILYTHKLKWSYFLFSARIPPGYIKRISDIIFELRRFGYTADTMVNAIEHTPEENIRKLEDLIQIQKLIESYMEPDLIDEFNAINQSAAAISNNQFEDFYHGIDEIYINGYGLFTPAMFEFIEKICKWKDVHIKLEHLKKNPDLFRHTAAAVERLGNYQENETTLFSKYLFNRLEPAPSSIQSSDKIHINSFDDRNREVEYIAEMVRSLHIGQAVPLQYIGVTFADLESYIPIIRQVFSEFGIPFNLSTGFRLMQSPLVSTFIEILTLKISGFDVQGVMRLLRSPLIKAYSEHEIFRLQKYIDAHRIRYLSESRFKKLVNDLLKAFPEDSQMEQLSRHLSDFLEPFYKLSGEYSIEEFRNTYMELLKHCGLLDWYKKENNYLNQRQKELEFRAFNRFLKLFDRTMWIIERLHPGKRLLYNNFLDYLMLALRDAVFNVTEWPEFGVQIMPRLELQAVEPSYLFLGGLVDGEFPRQSARDVFFEDDSRSKMGLITSESLLDQDRFLFYTILDSNAKQIYLSYPKYRGDRSLIPSAFIKELSESFSCEIKNDPGNSFHNAPQTQLQFGYALQQGNFETAKLAAHRLLAFSADFQDEVHSILNRVQIAQNRRMGLNFGIHEGMLDHQSFIEEINNKYKTHTWSVSQIEDYAACPMSFFLKRILGVEEEPEYLETMNSLEKGNLIHKILFEFFSTLKSLGLINNKQKHNQLLDQISERIFNFFPFRGLFWELEKQDYLGFEGHPGLLEKFININNEYISLSGMSPSFFELSFGNTPNDEKITSSGKKPIQLCVGDRCVSLKGKIDRIDIDDKGNYTVLDYKTGKNLPSNPVMNIIDGQSFQLSLYLLALWHLFPESNPVYGGLFQVADSKHCKILPVIADRQHVDYLDEKSKALLPGKIAIGDSEVPFSFTDLLNHSLSQAIDHIERLRSGAFHHKADPGSNFCQSYCNYRRMCQKNISKLERTWTQAK